MKILSDEELLEKLARLLFETDARVQDFLRTRAETKQRDDASTRVMIQEILHGLGPREESILERWPRACETAWSRDEGGWRTEAMARAHKMIVLMKREDA